MLSSYKNFTKIFCFLAFYIVFLGCESEQKVDNSSETKASQSKSQIKKTDPIRIVINSELNSLSKYCGMIDSSFCDDKEDRRWEKRKQKIESYYEKVKPKKELMSKWRRANLDSSLSTLFYPFSGPDFLHADIFFPNVDTIVMIGLEHLGTLTQLNSKICSNAYKDNLVSSLYMILNNSFFRTNTMAINYKKNLDGTLPVFLHFFSRNSYDIVNIKEIQIGSNAQISYELNCDSCFNGIEYTITKNNKLKTLYYFSENLSDSDYVPVQEKVKKDGLKKHPEFISFLRNLNIDITYLKAASYLLHRPYFSTIRNFIVDESKMILQDDSGIPIKYLNSEEWKATYYGSYRKPIPLFAERYQQNLYDIYHDDSNEIEPLDFGIGYKYHIGTSNLMLFKSLRK